MRGQAETFIALVVTAGMVVAFAATQAASDRGRDRAAFGLSVAAGVLFGLAFVYKYNAGVFLLPGLLVYLVGVPRDDAVDPRNRGGRVLMRQFPAVLLGFVLAAGVMAAWFASHGALGDLYQATIVYNLRYSGETYSGPWAMLRFLLTFPVRHARVDALWFLGGAGVRRAAGPRRPGTGDSPSRRPSSPPRACRSR